MKGIGVTSEIIMAIGMIALAVVFSLLSSQIISGQQSGLLSDVQTDMATELQQNIEQAQNFDGSTKITYSPSVDLYTVRTEDGNLILDIEGEETSSFRFQSVNVEGSSISNAESLCIDKQESVLEIREGECETIETSEICENGCDPNKCQPEYGEDCRVSACTYPENTESEEASQYCQPDYNPDYIDQGNSNTELGWVDQDYVDSQSQGDRCEENFECSGSLECNPSTPSSSSGKRCCPSGERWNGNSCEPYHEFNLVYVPARYNSQSAFESDAKEAHNYLMSKSPFNQCSEPRNAVNKEVLERDVCNINSCNVVSSDQCYQEMRECANQELGAGNWDKIVGLAAGQGPIINRDDLSGRVCGKSESIPSDVSVTYSSCGSITAAHEAGHSFGLYHVATDKNEPGTCVGPNAKDCNEPNRDEFIMTYAEDRDRYGPAGFEYLERDVLDDYLEVCS